MTLSNVPPPLSSNQWRYDGKNQLWQISITTQFTNINVLPLALSPSEVLVIRIDAKTQLTTPSSGLRVRYYHNDSRGAVTVVTDATGLLAQESADFPFGQLRLQFEAEPIVENYGFLQKEYDSESKLNFFEARYLLSLTGRFTLTDSLQSSPPLRIFFQPQTLNAYSYSLSNPINFRDPTGKETTREFFDRMFDQAAMNQSLSGQIGWGALSLYWSTPLGYEDLSKVVDSWSWWGNGRNDVKGSDYVGAGLSLLALIPGLEIEKAVGKVIPGVTDAAALLRNETSSLGFKVMNSFPSLSNPSQDVAWINRVGGKLGGKLEEKAGEFALDKIADSLYPGTTPTGASGLEREGFNRVSDGDVASGSQQGSMNFFYSESQTATSTTTCFGWQQGNDIGVSCNTQYTSPQSPDGGN